MTLPTPRINFYCAQLALSIGVDGMDGWVSSLQYQPDRYRRTGGRGSGAQMVGKFARAEVHPFWCACEDKDDGTDVAETLERLQGFTCRVTDQHRRVLNRVRVGPVIITKCVACRGPALQGGKVCTYRVEGTIELERLPDD